MARPAMFSDDQILDAALDLVAACGPNAATIAAISGAIGVSVGSIYHRFSSRELLMARLWIRGVKRFQRGFIEALEVEDLDEAAAVAVQHVLRWSQDHFAEVRVLLLHRREDLAAQWPEELGQELASLNRDVEGSLHRHAHRRYGRDDDEAMGRVMFALVDIPFAAARRYVLSNTPPPSSVNELLVSTCRFVLDPPPP